MLSGSQWDVWRWLARVGGCILLGRESCLRPGPRPVVHTQNHLGEAGRNTQIPSLHPGRTESEFSQDPQFCNLEECSLFLISDSECLGYLVLLFWCVNTAAHEERWEAQAAEKGQTGRGLSSVWAAPKVQGLLSAEKAEDGGARGLSFDVVVWPLTSFSSMLGLSFLSCLSEERGSTWFSAGHSDVTDPQRSAGRGGGRGCAQGGRGILQEHPPLTSPFAWPWLSPLLRTSVCSGSPSHKRWRKLPETVHRFGWKA